MRKPYMAMFNAKEIADLKTRIETLEGEAVTTQAAHATELTGLKASLEIAQAAAAEVPGLKEQITAEKARADKAEAGLLTATEQIVKLGADTEAKIEAEVVSRLAAAGTEGIQRDTKAKTGEGQTMARSEFLKLPHPQRNAFIRDGGKLSD